MFLNFFVNHKKYFSQISAEIKINFLIQQCHTIDIPFAFNIQLNCPACIGSCLIA